MAFIETERVRELKERVAAFMDEHVYPVEEKAYLALDNEVDRDTAFPQVLLGMREKARAEGLWNLALPDEKHGPGLTNLEYGFVSEVIGRSQTVAPYAFNVQPPDSGNMEILAEHGTPEQQQRWLEPLLEGEIRSCYSMTEPDTPGSDPTQLATTARLDGDEWVIDGRKWWTTNALGASLAIVMVVTDPDAPAHQRASMILVPTDTPGFDMVRPLSHMGHSEGPGHWEIAYRDCRVPKENLLGARGTGFKIAQDRLGPGRIHHCMRLIGVAERALEMLCRRAQERQMFGGALADKQFIQDFIAESRVDIHQARLVTQHAAWLMDTAGKTRARTELSITKLTVPRTVLRVVDRAIQVYGAAGVCDDLPLAGMWRFNRMLRIGDGADEVHKQVVARHELRKHVVGDDKPVPGIAEAAAAAAPPAVPTAR